MQTKQTTHTARFLLGRTVMTPGARDALLEAGQSPGIFLSRHVQGDWGNLGEDDKNRNDEALTDGSRILSAYQTRSGITLWIITEADRSATTILLPDEY